MTIKEMEQLLDIPRATIRFYEKEGLISPDREENGYRDYSKEDLDKIKKVVILRKTGLPVSDIVDLFDGAKTFSEILDDNMINLQKQLDELQGAINLNHKLKELSVDITQLDADQYLDFIENEEKQGHRFMTIAQDIASTEKGVIAEWFGWTSKEGDLYISWWAILRNAILCLGLTGVILCVFRGTWNYKNFLDGAIGLLCIMGVEAVLSIPLYFLGKKYPWIAKNRKKALFFAALLLSGLLLAIAGMMGE